MALVGADLDGVETEHAVDVTRRIRRPGAVAVIGQDHESKAGARGGGGDGRLVAGAVGSRAVNVVRAGDRARWRDRSSASIEPSTGAAGRTRDEQKAEQDTGRDERDQRPRQHVSHHQRPASALSAAALSVRSQVNSGSVRPKWPKAAVFL